MYVHEQVIQKVIKLFQNNPQSRDDRWGTIKSVWLELKYELRILDDISSLRLGFEVDRAFRYVQQHYPELRGETWLLRQKRAGEIKGDIEIKPRESKFRQLSIFDEDDCVEDVNSL